MSLLPTRINRRFLLFSALSVILAAVASAYVHQWATVSLRLGFPWDYIITIPIFLIILTIPFSIFMHRTIIRPINAIMRHNSALIAEDRAAAIIPAEEIPLNEFGDVMRTRNKMLSNLFKYQQELTQERGAFEALNQSLISYLAGGLEEGLHLTLQHVCKTLTLDSGWFVLYTVAEEPELVVTYNVSPPFMQVDSSLICLDHCHHCSEDLERIKIHPTKIALIQCEGLNKSGIRHSVLRVPLTIDGEGIAPHGFLAFPVTEEYKLSNSSRTLLEYIANTLELVLSQKELTHKLQLLNKTLERQVKERTGELQALYDLSQQLGYALTFDDLARSVLAHLQRIVPSDIAATVLRVDSLSLLIVSHRAPISAYKKVVVRERLVKSFSSVAGEEVAPTRFTMQLEECEGYDDSSSAIGELESAFMVPIGSGENTLGILFIGSKTKHSFNEDQIRFFYTISNHFLTALQQLRLRHVLEERRMGNVVAEIPDGLLLLDSENRVRMINTLAEEYLRTLNTPAETGERLTALDGHSLKKILNDSSNGRHYEITVGSSSKERIFEITAKSTKIEEQLGTLVIIRDVSEIRMAQKALRQNERLAAVGQLAAGIAHDFNNILQGIIGYSELLQRGHDISEKSRKYLSNIVQQGQRAAYLINQILDFSRQSISKSQPFNIAPLIQETIKFFQRTIPGNIDLSLDVEMKQAMIKADIVHVQQVLTNMVINARDAMPDGGSLKIRLFSLVVADGAIPPIPAMPHGRWVAFSISDTGSGIDREVLPRIFDPFFTTKEQGKGTGLGLSQAYGLISQDNGFIDVDSQVGRGATFTVYLPELIRKGQKPLQEPTGITESERKGEGRTILLVEDDPAVMDVNQSMLENMGYTVMTASNGVEALEVCRSDREKISLLLSDITMPAMNGIDLLKTVRRDFPSIQVVLMTGYPLPVKDVEEFKAMEVTCLQKPVNFQDLEVALEQALDEGEQRKLL
ncbi:MAG: ATP-binding protein [Thermodesulfobacteriota bacterium]